VFLYYAILDSKTDRHITRPITDVIGAVRIHISREPALTAAGTDNLSFISCLQCYCLIVVMSVVVLVRLRCHSGKM